jgi:dihydrofolate reductase
MQPFSDFINSVAKYVATSSELTPEWNFSSVIEGDLVNFVKELKTKPGRSIGVHASISVAKSLLQAGVVDELCLVIAPRIAGVGQKLFGGLSDIKLTVKESLVSPSGYFLVTYAANN